MLVYERREIAVIPLLIGDFVCSLEAVGSGLVRPENAEAVRVELKDIAGIYAQAAGSFKLTPAVAVFLDFLDLVVFKLWKLELFADHAAVSIRVCTDAQFAFRHELGDFFAQCAVCVKELFRLVGSKPVLEDLEMLFGIAGGSQRDLMGTP